MLKAVIFDMDGVLVDTEPLNDRHKTVYLKRMGIDITPNFFESLRGVRIREFWERIISEYGLKDDIDFLMEDSKMDYLQFLKSLKDFNLIPGINSLINRLESSGLKLAVASSAFKLRVETILEMFNIKNKFRVVISGDDVKKGKPHPEIYLLTAKKLQVGTGDCVVIEDSENGVVAAKSAGMKVVGFKGMSHNTQDLSRADLLISNFGELTYKRLISLEG